MLQLRGVGGLWGQVPGWTVQMWSMEVLQAWFKFKVNLVYIVSYWTARATKRDKPWSCSLPSICFCLQTSKSSPCLWTSLLPSAFSFLFERRAEYSAYTSFPSTLLSFAPSGLHYLSSKRYELSVFLIMLQRKG